MMSFSKNLLLALAASATLAACSSEPSDWRPDDKVSLDQVAPGTRTSDNFDLPAEGHGMEGGHTTNTNLDIHAAPTPAEARTANSVMPGEEGEMSKPVIEDTTARGHQIQR